MANMLSVNCWKCSAPYGQIVCVWKKKANIPLCLAHKCVNLTLMSRPHQPWTSPHVTALTTCFLTSPWSRTGNDSDLLLCLAKIFSLSLSLSVRSSRPFSGLWSSQTMPMNDEWWLEVCLVPTGCIMEHTYSKSCPPHQTHATVPVSYRLDLDLPTAENWWGSILNKV